MENKITLLKTFEQRQANGLFWAPSGRYLLVAGLRNMSGQLEFVDADSLESIAKETHQLCTDVVWDPTGRFVTTYVSNWKNKHENGYKIWTCRGKEIYGLNKDPFYQFLWRPKPPTLLSQKEIDNLMAPVNFKKLQKKIKEKEKEENIADSDARSTEEKKLRDNYRHHLVQRLKEKKIDTEWRKKMKIVEDDELFGFIQEHVEDVLEEKTEVIEQVD
jgi:translation initiation factor 3 subunit B